MLKRLVSEINRSNLFKTLTRQTLDRTLPPILKKYSKGEVLDVGSLHSPYKRYLKYKKYSILDIVENPGVDYLMDIHKTNLKRNSFDTVIATEVLEHLYNPFLAVEEMKRLLKPSGYLIASTRFIYPYHGEPSDYFRFTKFGLERLFSGYQKVEIITLGNRSSAIIDLFTTSNSIFKLMRPFVTLLTYFNNQKTKVPLGFVIIAQK